MLKKFLISLTLCGCLLNPAASAEIKIIEQTGEYTIDKKLNETFEIATEHAREDARKKAVLEAGAFVKSYSKIENNSLEDKFEVIAATIMEDVEPEDIRFVPIDGGKSTKIVCKIKVRVDTDKIDPAQIAGSQQQFETISEKDKIVAEKDAEIAKWKNLYENAVSEKQKLEIKNEFDKSQREFLIAKYERDLNIFDFDAKINWQTVYDTSQKLAELDALNPTAFRAAIYYYREQGDLKTAMDYCKRILQTNCPADTAIEANTQLGDMYYNEFNDKANAKKFIDAGIVLVKKTYSKAMIEKFVNGTNVEFFTSGDDEIGLHPIGKSNTIRELYILKSDIENLNPTFKSEDKIENLKLLYDKIYDLKYKTDW